MIFDKVLGELDGGSVLDLGCGSGQFTEVLVNSLAAFTSITGVDVDTESLEEARKNFNDGRIHFLKIDNQVLPWGEEEFDMVVISKALHHVEDPAATLADMKRVLRQGGHFLIHEMHRNELSPPQESHMLYHHLRSEIDNQLGVSHNYTFLREDLLGFADLLELNDRSVMEYTPDSGVAKDPANIREFTEKMEGWMQMLGEHPRSAEFRDRVETLKHRFAEHGISRPPMMLILGRK